MIRRLMLLGGLGVLGWGLWISPDFAEVAAGIAIFLFGMAALEQGFQAFTGGTLERLLTRWTDTLWKSLGFGMVTTAVVQSSSLVSVLAISFLSAGLIGLTAGIGIVFGANIGTTTGAWLIAGIGLKLDIAALALPMIVFGVILTLQTGRSLRGLGYVLAGIGFVFLGIHYMKTGFESLQDGIDLTRYALTGFGGLVAYTAIGIAATVVMQSSHAALTIALTALAAGQITYDNSLAIAIGSNIGTTVTALLGAMSANAAGRRLALAHVCFNLAVGALALLFIGQFRAAVDLIAGGLGIAPDGYALKFAVFHTLFNVVGVAIMVPLIPALERLLRRLVPDPVLDVSQPYFLNDAALALPDTALEAITNEIDHLYDNAVGYMAAGLGIPEKDLLSDRSLDRLVAMPLPEPPPDLDDLYQRRIKGLHGAILDFTVRATPGMLPAQLAVVQDLRAIARDLVTAIKDVKHLNKNIRRYARAPNPDIAAQYNGARALIVSVMRKLDEIRHAPDVSQADLGNIRARMEAAHIVENGTLDRLFGERRITPDMATSLINDTAYVQNICQRLVDAAGILVREARPAAPPAEPATAADRPAAE